MSSRHSRYEWLPNGTMRYLLNWRPIRLASELSSRAVWPHAALISFHSTCHTHTHSIHSPVTVTHSTGHTHLSHTLTHSTPPVTVTHSPVTYAIPLLLPHTSNPPLTHSFHSTTHSNSLHLSHTALTPPATHSPTRFTPPLTHTITHSIPLILPSHTLYFTHNHFFYSTCHLW